MSDPNLLQKLTEYCASDYVPFHMPGHKRNLNGMPDPFSIDITEIDGFDDLHHPEGILRELQEKSAAFYGSKETYFLVNGSTAGILAAISAVCRTVPLKPAENPQKPFRMIMARNSHRSAYHGVYLNEVDPVYVYPEEGRTKPFRIEEAFCACPDAAAVFVTSPTYEGMVSDIRQIARIAHDHQAVLIVDEAHGAHFGLHPSLPETAVRLGADIVIQSLHKTLPSLTQTALLHICTDRIDTKMIRRFLSVYQTSSPSYVLMASMDSCIRMMRERGEEIFENVLKEVRACRERIRPLKYIRFLDTDDPCRLLISAPDRLSGERICGTLRHTFHIESEMAVFRYALCLIGAGDTGKNLQRLACALEQMDAAIDSGSIPSDVSGTERLPDLSFGGDSEPDRVMPLHEAWDAPGEDILLRESIGRTAGTFVYMYPPGIPVLVPGESIDAGMCAALQRSQETGHAMHGLTVKKEGVMIRVIT